jgi:exodeoxyribonuclease VII large subunit
MTLQIPLFGAGSYAEPPQVWTVTSLTRYVKRRLESDQALQDVWLEGEISNCRQPVSGHLYFTLKDADSSINCVMWRDTVRTLPELPQDGQAVLVHGRISVYEVRGTYQLYVDSLQPAGRGLLYAKFEALKARLAAEGLFDEGRKRPLPPFPRRLGVVTSPQAAALRDILNVLRRRYPPVEVLLAPTLVQGEEAPPQIVAAIESLNARDDVDVIIVARGGGSLEELWAFNDEDVARAIANSRIPVISGVGHETDFTIADFAADVRAPTPSAAAELAVPDQAQLRDAVKKQRERLVQACQKQLAEMRKATTAQRRALERSSPLRQIERWRQQVDERSQNIVTRCRHYLALRRERLEGLRARLLAVSPLATLERGYAIVQSRDGSVIIKSVGQVATGYPLRVQVRDGQFDATAD